MVLSVGGGFASGDGAEHQALGLPALVIEHSVLQRLHHRGLAMVRGGRSGQRYARAALDLAALVHFHEVHRYDDHRFVVAAICTPSILRGFAVTQDHFRAPLRGLSGVLDGVEDERGDGGAHADAQLAEGLALGGARFAWLFAGAGVGGWGDARGRFADERRDFAHYAERAGPFLRRFNTRARASPARFEQLGTRQVFAQVRLEFADVQQVRSGSLQFFFAQFVFFFEVGGSGHLSFKIFLAAFGCQARVFQSRFILGGGEYTGVGFLGFFQFLLSRLGVGARAFALGPGHTGRFGEQEFALGARRFLFGARDQGARLGLLLLSGGDDVLRGFVFALDLLASELVLQLILFFQRFNFIDDSRLAFGIDLRLFLRQIRAALGVLLAGALLNQRDALFCGLFQFLLFSSDLGQFARERIGAGAGLIERGGLRVGDLAQVLPFAAQLQGLLILLPGFVHRAHSQHQAEQCCAGRIDEGAQRGARRRAGGADLVQHVVEFPAAQRELAEALSLLLELGRLQHFRRRLGHQLICPGELGVHLEGVLAQSEQFAAGFLQLRLGGERPLQLGGRAEDDFYLVVWHLRFTIYD